MELYILCTNTELAKYPIEPVGLAKVDRTRNMLNARLENYERNAPVKMKNKKLMSIL
jgi:hypothetical protein